MNNIYHFSIRALRALPVFLLIPFLATGCSKGGGEDFEVPVNEKGFGSSSSQGRSPLTRKDLGSVTLPPNSSTWIRLSGSAAPSELNTFIQGGSNVNQIIFESGDQFSIDAIKADGVTLYDWNSDTQSWVAKTDDPIPFWSHYAFHWALGGANLSVNLPVTHTAQSSFPSGDYEFKLFNWLSSELVVDITQIHKNEPDFFSGVLDLNLIIYTAGEPNRVVPDNGEAQNIKGYLNDIFGQIDVSIGELNVEFREDADLVSRMINAGWHELEAILKELSRSSAGRSDTGVNCFLFPRLPFNILGIDGAIPGPAGHGFSSSGLLAQASDYGFTAKGYSAHEMNQRMLAKILAHEIGHYMGLYHTSEATGSDHDPLPDTPECDQTDDWDGDGIIGGSECANKGADHLMFWASDPGLINSGDFQLKMTRDEGDVVNTHPLVR